MVTMLKELKNDLISLCKDPFSLCILLLPFPLITLLLFFALGKGELEKMPIGILDNDQTQTSREIEFSLNASPALKIYKHYTSLEDAKEDLLNARIFGVIVFPKNLQSNSKKGIETFIPFYYNAQFLLVAKTLQSKVAQIIATENVKVKMAKNLVENKTFIGALSKSAPIMQQMTALYNPDSSYSQFLLTAILPCSFVILVCCSLLNAFVRDPRTAFSQNVNNSVLIKIILAKLFNNTIFYTLWWWAMMGFFTYIMDLPMRGSWDILFGGAFLMILAYESITIFLYAIAKQSTRAISFISVYSAPSFAFAGVTFPLNSMNTFALFWSQILPISHYLELYIHQANYGRLDGSSMFYTALLPFLLFGIAGSVIFVLRNKQ